MYGDRRGSRDMKMTESSDEDGQMSRVVSTLTCFLPADHIHTALEAISEIQ